MKCPKCNFENPDDSVFCRKCGTRMEPAADFSASPTQTLGGAAEGLFPGATFAGRYKVIEDLGEGGMGRVYKVFDTELNEKVALKFIQPEIAADKKTIERFQNELKFARKVSHKNICRMYHLSKENDAYYLTMEYVEGESLKSMVKMTKQLSIATALHIAMQACEGLAEAHRQAVIHRDLKPQNIIVDKDGNVRIMDFGIARYLQKEKGTGPGVVLGTPEYMSPEQAEAKDVDGRSDIYSLGIILYEMVTGRVPFEGDSLFQVIAKHRNQQPTAPQQLNSEISNALNQVILKCLEKKKEDRYQTAAALYQDLAKIDMGLHRRESSVLKKKTSDSRTITVSVTPKKLILPAAVLLAVVASALLIWRSLGGKVPGLSPSALSVAVISFVNQTGDASFDYLQEAIPNLLITSLEQSRHIRVATWERLYDLLKQLGRQGVRVIDRDLGFELCRLDGIDTIILGSYIKAGNMFATDVKVVDVKSKQTIKSAGSRGEGVDSILKRQIDELSNEIERGIAASARGASEKTSPVATVTTDSMEAYNHFLKGREAYENMNMGEAQALLEKAVQVDPQFPLPYVYLANVHRFRLNDQAATAALENFKKFKKKIPGKEGLYLDALTARYVEKNEEKNFQILKKLVAEYPKEKHAYADIGEYYREKQKWPESIAEYQKALEIDPKFGLALNDIAYVYLSKQEFDKALRYFEQYAAAYPNDANPHDSMAEAHFLMGQYDRAIEKYKEALKIRPDFGSDFRIGYCYAVQENYAEALRWTDQFIAALPSNNIKAQGYLLKGFYYHILGRLEDAFKEWDAAEALLRSVQDASSINIVKRNRLWACYDWGKADLFLQYAQERVDQRRRDKIGSEPVSGAYAKFYEGLYHMKKKQVDSAAGCLAEIESLLPQAANEQEKNLIQDAYYQLSAEIILARGRTDEAIAEFQKRPPLPLAISNIVNITFANLPLKDDFAARAALAKGDRDKAIAEYERILQPANISHRLINPLSRYRLARLYEEKGRPAKAVEQYQKLAETWKDADPDLEEVKESRARLAALQSR